MSPYPNAHAKFLNPFFFSKILELRDEIGTIFNHFLCSILWLISIKNPNIHVENRKNPGIEPSDKRSNQNEKPFFWTFQTILFSSNHCLPDFGTDWSTEECYKAKFICTKNNTNIVSKEKQTYKTALKACKDMNGHLCKQFSKKFKANFHKIQLINFKIHRFLSMQMNIFLCMWIFGLI